MFDAESVLIFKKIINIISINTNEIIKLVITTNKTLILVNIKLDKIIEQIEAIRPMLDLSEVIDEILSIDTRVENALSLKAN